MQIMKIILAYSGGLDTSVALRWLQNKYSAEVIAFCADIGQFESFNAIESRAIGVGAAKVYIDDLKEEYLRNYVFKALKANAAYEGQYLLAAPLGRPLIAKRLVEIARQEAADAVAHGATGKGNDQVRFYSSIVAHAPNMKIIAPVMEWDMKSREEEIEYAKKHQIDVSISVSKPYSIDTNIWGTSIECGMLDDIKQPPPDDVYQISTSPLLAPDEPYDICIGFEKGIPVSLDGKFISPVELVSQLNDVGSRHGIGRIDILENRVVGIKTRGIYESPAGAILHFAHKELENLVLDRDLLHYKARVSQEYSELVYYGLWFSPLRKALDTFVDYTQLRVNGYIKLRIYKGNIIILSRDSEYAMYEHAFSTYDTEDRFNHKAGDGFSYIWSMPLRVKSENDLKLNL
jgi:argininosuccinate synthase